MNLGCTALRPNRIKWVAPLALLVGAGCAPRANHDEWRQAQAGQSNAAMGIVVDGADVAQMEAIEKAGGRVREVYGGVFEVQGLSEKEIRASAPKASVYKNKFFPYQRPPAQPKIPPCSAYETLPHIGWVTEPRNLVTENPDPVVIKRNGQKIKIGLGGPGISKIVYRIGVIEAPAASNLSPESRTEPLIADNRPLEFVTDEMGKYTVMAVLQLNSNQRCSVAVEFGVTDNAPFLGAGYPLAVPLSQKLQNFSHLAMIGADKAWSSTQGEGVVIAVVDSGVNYNHPALRANIKINSKEIADNGRDDDRNGLVDDVVGWDFINQDASPFDDYKHGTHVSGLAVGSVGVAPKAKVLPVKALGMFGGDGASIAGGIRYAVDSGAQIINMSLGSDVADRAIASAITYSESKGVLVVVAAGNDGVSIEQKPVFPASFKNANLLVVAATDLYGRITDYSNYGAYSVDIAAPGGTREQGLNSANYSNGQNRLWVTSQGTSMATPLVAGVAALVLSSQNRLNAIQLKQAVIANGINKTQYRGQVASEKLVDARELARP
jgi:subtilisin family serine protease